MPNHAGAPAVSEGGLLDEVEQLRTALECALDENARLVEDRDRLERRNADLTREVQDARAESASVLQEVSPPNAYEIPKHREVEEELRVAFEELQVLTEELEVANTGLTETNKDLDARVEARTREIREINAALRATEGSLRTIADLVPDLLWRSDAQGNVNWVNRRWFSYTGQDLAEPMGRGWAEVLHPLDRAAAAAAWQGALAGGAASEQQLRIRDAAGAYRWFLIRAEPMRDEHGRIVAWYAAGTDVHEQRVAMETLRHSELRFRTLVEGMPQLVWRAVDGGQWTWCSPQWTGYTGQSEPASRGLGWLEMFHPADRDAARAAWARAGETGSLEVEGRIFHAAENRHRHFRTRALPVRGDAGHALEWLGTSTNVDDILQLQGEQEVLVAELQHRTRNLMGVIQSVTRRTLGGSTSLEQFGACIKDRFDALSRVQGLLSRRQPGMRVTFDQLVRAELSAHVEIDEAGLGAQVMLDGPAGVPLRSATVQTFALALHELATNAVKYGALSQPEARLEVRWDVRETAPGERWLCVDWREHGMAAMPDAAAPARGGGYGRELIERALPYQLGARTSYRFEADGVHCTIEVRIPDGESSRKEQVDG